MKYITYIIAGFLALQGVLGFFYSVMHPELTQMQVFLWMWGID